MHRQGIFIIDVEGEVGRAPLFFFESTNEKIE